MSPRVGRGGGAPKLSHVTTRTASSLTTSSASSLVRQRDISFAYLSESENSAPGKQNCFVLSIVLSGGAWFCCEDTKIHMKLGDDSHAPVLTAFTAVVQPPQRGPVTWSTTHVRSGDAVLASPGLAHGIQAEPGSRVACFSLWPTILRTNSAVFSAEIGVFSDYFFRYAFSVQAPGPLFLPCDDQLAPRVAQRVDSIARHLGTGNQTDWDLFASAEFTCLLILLARGAASAAPAPDHQSGLLTQILRFIQDNYSEVTLRRLAGEFNYSPTHLARLLLRHCGRSFADVRQEFRLTHAMDYLQTSGLSVEQIAVLVGFSSAKYFTQVFHREVGMSPGQFRAQADVVGLSGGSGVVA